MTSGAFEEYQDLLKRLEISLNNEKSYINKIKRIEKEYDALNKMYKNEVKLRAAIEADSVSKHSFEGVLVKSLSYPLFYINKSLAVVYYNNAAFLEFGEGESRKLNGAALKNIIAEKYGQEMAEKCVSNCKTVLETKKICSYIEKMNIDENDSRIVEIEICPAPAKDGTLEGVTISIRNLSYIFDLVEDEKKLSSLKTDVLSEIKYEIKNPLNSIKGMSDLLIKSGLERNQEHYVNKIKASGEILLNIIDYSTDFSQIEDKNLEIVNDEYEFPHLIESIVNVFAIKAASKNIELIVHIDTDMPARFCGDALMLKQVFVSVLTNSLKYVNEGSVKINIFVDEKKGKQCILHFEIQDSGVGITKEQMETLEEALVHQNPIKCEDSLFAFNFILADKILKLMSGSMNVSSEVGQGTKVSLEVLQEIRDDAPIARVLDFEKKRILLMGEGGNFELCKQVLKKTFVAFDTCDNEEEFINLIDKNEYTHIIYWYESFHKIISNNMLKIASKKIISVRKTGLLNEEDFSYSVNTLFEPILVTELFTTLNLKGSSPNARKELNKDNEIGQFRIDGANILIVDDNEINLIVAEEMLKSYGVEPDCASDGSVAVDLAYQKKYDMVFMDHLMPGMDGLEAASRIKKQNTINMDTPIIAFTANSIVGMREIFLESGMNDYMTKPIETKELNRILYKWLPENKIILATDNVEKIEVKNVELFAELMDKLEIDGYSSIRNLDGKENVYLSILETFINTLKAKIDSLVNNFKTGTFNLYRIEVHALKSSLANIGADNLSEMAKKLEISAVNDDINYINANNNEFISGLENLYEGLREILSKNKYKDEIADKDSRIFADINNKEDSINKLRGFLEMLDTTSAFEIIEELESFDFGNEVNAYLEQLKIAVDCFDYDTALLLLDKLTDDKQA